MTNRNTRQDLRRIAAIGVLAAACLAPAESFACSACGCTLNSDWASQGLTVNAGWHADVRFDYFDQDQLRSGSDSVSRTSLIIPNDAEVQKYTINRNYTFALDYNHRAWGLSVALPWYDRSHATVAAGDAETSISQDRGIGDLRVLGRYSGLDSQRGTGVQFGLKLPTGGFTSDFRFGPQSGTRVDRGLQLGTGTTDLLLGAYHFGAITSDWGYFGQILLSQPLNSREDFRPGTGANIDIGIRYSGNPTWVPQLQINTRFERRESGANADVKNSGASLVYVSPGITWNLSRRFAAYVVLQLPLHQRVNGLQIETRKSGSVGFHYKF